ncbi:BatD family protein [Desulfoluna butyratoxydans]|uniref:Aerotolerance-related protein batd n=1 Tax=Desulfoluna butyratoxydans TaxID=231438 RepID=A0A4V6IM31_9BACT|nr:BatD family protein [Desulfoluna butyratoxydans]VFQ47498.1 aerotolerance-related protein batd [Desulfoluna butyratoxydans]
MSKTHKNEPIMPTATANTPQMIPPRLRLRRFCLLFLGVALLLPLRVGAEALPEKIRVSLAPEGTVKVGQRVTLSIELMTTTRFSGSPGFDIPEIPGVIALKLNTFGINSTETTDGVTYSVQGHEFALFAQRPGKRVIKPFDVRFYPAGPGAAPPREVTLKTEPLTLDAVMPPGAEGLSALICTAAFELTEAWEPPPQEARVGDAFTRRITMRADDVPGMAFPPLEVPDIRSVGIYPKEPFVNDKTDRGDFTGERTETITYVCEAKGTVTFPEVTVHWWDLNDDSLKVETLPAVTLKVKANPSLLTGTDAPLPLSSWNRAVPWLLFSGIVLALCVGAAIKYRSVLGALLIPWLQTRKRAEKACFKAIKAACRAKDPAAAYGALLTWLETTPKAPCALTPALLSDITRNPPLAEQANRLQRQLFQSSGSQGPSWDAPAFFKALCTSRRRLLKKEKTKRAENGLPGLNPS